MNKTELIESIAKTAGLSKTDATAALNAMLEAVVDTIKEGGQVAIAGFGAFSVANRASRNGRNPKTGEIMEIKASVVPKFKPGKALKDAVQGECA